MQRITKEQESTLKKWASYHQERPQNGDLAYLVDETGLGEEDISHWWTTTGGNHIEVDTGFDKVNTSELNASDNLHELSSYDSIIHNFDQFKGNSNDDDLTMSNVMAWSPLEEAGDAFLSMAIPGMESELQDSWKSMPPRQDLLQSSTWSFADNSSVLSAPSVYGSSSRASSRSSGFSYGSSRTWDTVSNLFTVDESEFTEQPSLYPGEATDSSSMLSSPCFSSKKPFDARKIHHPNTQIVSQQPSKSPSKPDINLESKKLPDTPTKSEKPRGKYICTTCRMPFSCKGDWKRHEGSQCEPQELWYCMHQDPVIRIQGEWYCVFCNEVQRDRNGMVQHLINQHRFHLCAGKSLPERSFKRKDKLKDHLRKVHNLAKGSTGWEGWHQDAPKKWAWGCGFCGGCLFSWAGRLEHIAEHYEKQQDLSISHWTLSNVIKGLLKQPNDFDVYTAWRSLVDNNDQCYVWSDKDAMSLKRKLELRRDTPKSIAEEAYHMAKRSSKHMESKTWHLPESQAAVLARDMLAQPLRKPSMRTNENKYLTNFFLASANQTDAKMQDNGPAGYI